MSPLPAFPSPQRARPAGTPTAAPVAAAVPVLVSAPLGRGVAGLRRLTALFIFLWVFEGALRKWLLPSLANPLLIVRDPVLLLMYFQAFRHGLFPRHPLVFGFLGLGALGLAVTILATGTPTFVALFGFRANFLHLPLIFLLPRILDRTAVLRIGQGLLLLAGPMAALVFVQFISPSEAWINTGAGGEGKQIESAMGHIRPPGTFSFTNGLVGFAGLLLAFFLYHLLIKRVFPRLIWLVAGGALVVIVALSGSRQMVGLAGLGIGAVLLTCVIRPKFLQASLKLIVLTGLVVVVLGSAAVFREGMSIFTYRFGDEENVQSGFFGRYLQSLVVQPHIWRTAPTFGLGLGRGTNAGAGLMTGQRLFLLAEGEVDRVVLESGPLLGSVYIFLRFALSVTLVTAGVRTLMRQGDPLALLLAAVVASDVFQGQFSQPTALGFATIAAGLSLSAAVVPAGLLRSGSTKSSPPPLPAPPSPAPAAPRGRSAYAERLHRGGDDAGVENATPPAAKAAAAAGKDA